VAHYRHFGGFSPYNRFAMAQAEALAAELVRRGRPTPVEVGFRHWSPWIADACRSLAACDRVAVLMLAPHRAGRSTDAYLSAVEQAFASGGPSRVVCPTFHEHPGLAEAVAARVRQATVGWSAERRAVTEIVFTAHAIPQPAEAASGYRAAVEASAHLAASACAAASWSIAYQSAPGSSRVPWSQPTIEAHLATLAARGMRDVVIQPIGFLVDHMEVLYDLDIEAMLIAERLNLKATRAGTVGDHPAFIRALADSVEAALV
jgi:ferrochelatase